MNITQGNIFWNSGMNIKYSYPYLKQDKSCDILVIGGGMSGALSAYYQAKQGYNVIIIEKNLIGFNSTLENIGAMYSKLDSINCVKRNTSEIKRLQSLFNDAKLDLSQIVKDMRESGFEVEYTECDYLNFSSKATGRFALSKIYDTECINGEKINLVEQNEIFDIYSALEYKDKGVILNPYIFNQELVQMLSQMPNVEVYENTCAESINSKEREVEVQTTNRFKIHASKVILATGVDLIKYLKEDMLDIYKTYNVVAKLSTNVRPMSFVAKENGTDRILRVTNEQVILSGEDIKRKLDNASDIYEERQADGKYKKLYNVLSKLLNEDSFKIKNCFYGVFLQTSDGLGIIDEIDDMPNVYCNLGVGKNGILQNVIGAKMLKNIYGDCYTKDMYLFRISR